MASTKATDKETKNTTTPTASGKDRFKGCFTATPSLEYDITFDGEVIARGMPLSARTRARIHEKSIMEGTDGELSVFKLQFYTVLYSLVSWDAGVPLNETNLDKMTQSEDGMAIYVEMHRQFTMYEERAQRQIMGNSKN